MNEPRHDLEALSAAVGQELARLGVAQADGRVAAAPDARSVRFYQGLGLVDRPALRGRRAIYGERQLRQLVAIKLLQSRGLALAEIQRRLYGLAPSELEQLIAAAAPPAPAVAASAAVSWRELLLAPGVRLAVEAGGEAGLDPDELAERARAALAALVRKAEGTRGGRRE
jgi:DNA-binding transcriptional MerR regulator